MNELQQQASDPQYSVWVSASAGTGKTKILTDRVLRLLISGTPFNKILCLTFTNAAALEMQSRIRSKLARFAVDGTTKLTKELGLLLTREPLESEVQYTKTLYYRLLNSEDGINIYTIHAFCQKMLKLFPLESSINPEFQILDDITAQGVINKIRNQIYLDPTYNELISFFLTNFHEVTINDIFSEIIQQKIKFKKLFAKQVDYKEHQTISSCIPGQLPSIYGKARQLLAKYSIAINLDQEIQLFFLTKEGTKRKNMLSKSIATNYPKLLNELEYIQEKVFQLEQQTKVQDMENYSNLLCNLAKIFLDKYESYKTENSLLDYDDLIYLTQLLLTDDTTKNWVSYKLDGGIEHLLVDEAQDTSPEQWSIITAIIAEFYSTTKHKKSTIFVVGDEKQSIFSFQGANLSSFNSVNANLCKKFSEANKNFKNITLEWSYRSTEKIIDIVYLILQQIKNTTPQLFTSENPKILPFRQNDKGIVELWPIVRGEKETKLFWPLPEEHNKSKSAQQVLAEQIANFIKSQIASQKILHATNSEVKESDFMILVRKRDELVFEVIDCLKQHGLQVEDVDRITLDKSLSVLDLIAIAKFVLLPQDDLNLIGLLKSPIIGMGEQELQLLAISRGKNSIWEYLQNIPEYTNIYNKLCYFLQIYKVANCGNFFSLIVDCWDIRKILVESNGFDSNDVINELIYLSINYANNIDSSLQNFVYWFENNKIDIKRNLESSSKIKVMTVHASKGLQAPIVILCDTSSVPTNSNKFIWDQDGIVNSGGVSARSDGATPISNRRALSDDVTNSSSIDYKMFSVPQSSNSPEFFKALKEQEQQKDLQEYIRLLYVAMTRAEDHLVICGYQSNSNKLPQDCWYELVSRVMNMHGKLYENGVIVYETTKEYTGYLPGENKEDIKESDNDPIADKKLIEWLPNLSVINKTTKGAKQNYSVNSPLIVNDHLEYGRIFHKILEDAVKINDFSSMNTHPFIGKLPTMLQEKIHKNIDKLLNNLEFMALISQELKTEVPIGINLNDGVKIGRIDLLAIDKGKLTIIDYKSDANPPKNCQLVKESYIDQLNFYRHLLAKLYPNNEIICKILWLEDASFMTIS
ncbi:MAG: UvrD-helicase domain-containing protein [Rickettsia endosymbiont of Culicoides impunctatus]|nr:MAG: UvrD-helicase domain-containing protein [Rickettsia endosymbiont of Culicoides impunctatus]